MRVDYSGVTESPGDRVTREALSMMLTRYAFSACFCAGKDVLEVACGAGQGLGYLARTARRVVGGDYTEHLLQVARNQYGDRMSLVRLDAQALPFSARSFDVMILHEAIYYLGQPDRFLEECRRVLRDSGLLLISTVNREWSDFNASPFSTRYFSPEELSDLLRKHQFQVELYGGFPVSDGPMKDVVVSVVKRTAVALNLMPKTMKGKEFLKRIFFGRLVPIPAELKDGIAEYALPAPVEPGYKTSQYKVLYAVASAR